MKRFIDLRGQTYYDEDDKTPIFAFYCTYLGKFEEFNDAQTWDDFEDFKGDYLADGGTQLIRYQALCPDWVFKKEDKS